MRVVKSAEEMEQAFVSATNEASKSFSDGRIFIEKERECSIQRNNQKVIEETPSPFLDKKTRQSMYDQCVSLAKRVNYFSVGTVEFVIDEKRFYFLEMNTRLQVEHPVTELVTRIDLVEEMIKIADGGRLSFSQNDVRFSGSAIEARIYAEDPKKGFLPSSGRIKYYSEPPVSANLRIDSGVIEGANVSMFYDPMIAKVSSHGGPDKRRLRLCGRLLTGSTLKGDPLTPEIAEILAFAALHIYLEDESRNYGKALESEKLSAHVGDFKYRLHVRCSEGKIFVALDHKKGSIVLSGTWHGNYKMLEIRVDDASHWIKVRASSSRYVLKYMAVEALCSVHRANADSLLQFMPEVTGDGASSDVVVSPIAGMVVNVYVKSGDEVSVGQPLLVIEAMKMENLICSEVQARVAEVLCTSGGSVVAGDVIIKFVGK
ncbi:hypothetical protein GH714_042790 [Hevea brasiliensis]|uniref:Propionyl-CoA carboxylase alpha chain, mitochondrial n=1 Tax=Hevea brasiliensis TaxID=3981 RepID=A0A6A6K1L2_HEVBR|nr:hypothetical protein GH714_042790 [Hevea brasiliensis]